MAIEIKEFDTMVDDVLRRISNSTNISNVNSGSVIRTIVEALISEQDIQYYQISRILRGMNIDTATDSELDNLVKILGIVRKNATKCVSTITFGRSEALDVAVAIPIGSTVSTYPDVDGNTTEFVVMENSELPANTLEVNVECTAKSAGEVYIPANTVNVINKPIINIEYVKNSDSIYGGSDIESDEEFRDRAKNSLALLGKGTIDSLEAAVASIDGVQDTICIDMARGVGTANMVIVTTVIPPSQELKDTIANAISENKAAGIDVQVAYPTIKKIDITVNTTGYTNADDIGGGILEYALSLSLGDSFVISQMERYVLNKCNVVNMDVSTITPTGNVTAEATEIIRNNTITINGVVWNG